MTNRSGEWDEETGYRFNPDKERVPLPGKDESPQQGGEPVHNPPEEGDDLDESVQDVKVIERRVAAMKSGQEEEPDQQVDISRSSDGPRSGITSDETGTNPEFQRRRIRNRAVRKVKEHLRSRGYPEEFIRENEDVIREKVVEFLS